MEQLENAISIYESWLAEGRPQSADELVAAHPEVADLLRAMVADRAALDRAVIPDGEETPVLGDFRILDEIGRGGMGVVYRARQRSLDREVALKVLPGHVGASAIARFKREAALTARLDHEGIVKIYTVGSHGDVHFFAMELVDGAPLDRIDPRTGRQRSVRSAVQVCLDVAEALAYAHARGVLHRDVKPSNILVRRDGRPVLTDFGLARGFVGPGITVTGAFAGTPHYAAPEQARGDRALDGRADVFALGVTLYELLTGRRPFDGESSLEVLDQIQRKEPIHPRRIVPDLAPDLAAIVMKALEKPAARRYCGAAELAEDLRAFLEHRRVAARPPTSLERLRRWTRREPWRALAAAVALLAVPGMAGAFVYVQVNAADIAAGRVSAAERAREEGLARVWWHAHEVDPASALALLDELPLTPDRETGLTRVLLLQRLGSIDEARAALAEFASPGDQIVELVRRCLDDPLAAIHAAGTPPRTAFDCHVMTQLLTNAAEHRGATVRPLLQRALVMARRAVVLAPVPRLTYLLGLAHAAAALDDTDASEIASCALERHFPVSLAALRARAAMLAHTQPEAALRLLEQAALADPTTAAGLARVRSVALEKLGRLEEAAAVGRAAVEQQPGDVAGWINLGNVLRKLRRHDEAVAACRQALTIRPEHCRAWNSLGLALRSAGDVPGARRAFERALELRADYAAAAYNLGNLLRVAGELPAAAGAFERAAAADPGDVRAAANLGDVLERLGRRQEALRWHLRAAELAPSDLIPHYNTSTTSLELGLSELALAAARRAAEIDVAGHHGQRALAAALLAQDPPAAVEALAAAAEADRRCGGRELGVRVLHARAVAAIGDRARALAMLEAAESDPAFATSPERAALAAALAALRSDS